MSIWFLIRLQNGQWEIPGGTLEPEESYLEALCRELKEEAGAELKTFQMIGAWYCTSMAEKPYRAHLPFPHAYRVVGVGEIKVVQKPENPIEGEQVVEVERVSLSGARQRFEEIGREDLAELYELAAEVVEKWR